jgi:hypothetical protein
VRQDHSPPLAGQLADRLRQRVPGGNRAGA